MTKKEIAQFLDSHKSHKDRTIIIVDFSNVERWKDSLGWNIGIKQLGNLVKNLSEGAKYLRRFYYGSDYGPNDRSQDLLDWSKAMPMFQPKESFHRSTLLKSTIIMVRSL